MGRGDAYVASGETEENLAAALADYEAALDLDETLVDAWLGLADVHIYQGDFDAALELLQQGLEENADSENLSNRIDEIRDEVDLRDWALESPIRLEELTIGGVPFYQQSIYDAQRYYPPDEYSGIYENGDGLLMYSASYQYDINSGHTGWLQFQQREEQGGISNVLYRYYAMESFPSAQYEPEFRGILLGEDTDAALEKIGFTEAGIAYIQNSVASENGGVFGDYTTMKQWKDQKRYTTYYNETIPAVSWDIINENEWYLDLSWWNDDASVHLQFYFYNGILDRLNMEAV